MNNEERDRYCGNCKFMSYTTSMEPCKTCIYSKYRGGDYHPNFQPQKHSKKEEKVNKRTCRNCMHFRVLQHKEPCFSCLLDAGLPHFRERCEDTGGNMTRSEILTEANNIVSGNRKAGECGQPEDSFGVVAGLWSEYLDQKIKPHDVAVMMALLKIARIKGGEYKLDNWIDLAGYAACGGECQAKEQGE